MPDKIIHQIQVDGYCARFDGKWGRLQLGTFGSYGIEQLQISLGDSWTDLVVYANFVTADGTTPVLVPESGLVDVPPEATAKPGMGNIVLDGTADGVRIYSVNIPYIMLNHSDLSGEAPAPTPDRWEQYVAQVKDDADRAEQAAGAAADSAAAAAKSAEAAAESAKQAEQAGADIGAAKDDALEAIQQAQDTGVQAVEGATTTGVQAVHQAHQDALDDIATERETALEAVQTEGDKQQSAITSGGAAALEAIGQTEQAAIGQVQQAGQAQLDKINAANALVPTPTQADAGKAIIVKPDGSGYEFSEVQTDAYTKAESDARYAPIEAAIRPTVSGNPATLEHSVAWAMQGLSVYGKSTQDGTPSPDNPVPIVSAGDGGNIGVSVMGKNLLNLSKPIINGYNVVLELKNVKINLNTQYTFLLNKTVNDIKFGLFLSDTENISDSTKQFNLLKEYLPVKSSKSFIFPDNLSEYSYLVIAGDRSGISSSNVKDLQVQLEVGPTATPYEPYKGPQLLTVSTPNGLPGIPVDSGGNYTDASGQQWVCDEVDFEKGVYVQRTSATSYNGTENWETWGVNNLVDGLTGFYCHFDSNNNNNNNNNALNTLLKQNDSVWGGREEGFNCSPPGTSQYIICTLSNDILEDTSSNELAVRSWKNVLANKGMTAIFTLVTPIETPLSAEELAAYAALRSYNGTTIVSTEAPVAGLSARYVADGAAYIDSKIQSAVTQAVAAAVSLTGGAQ